MSELIAPAMIFADSLTLSGSLCRLAKIINMKLEMLHSQFETVEPPKEDQTITIPIDQSIDEILAQFLPAISQLSLATNKIS